MNYLKQTDPQVNQIITKETQRQQDKLNMIPSENIASKAVMNAVGSVLMNKYAEGQVNARYYEGGQYADQIEQLAKDRLRTAFKLPQNWSVIVQALSGSPANLAVYAALLSPGDKILSMYLADGGHLSHGWSYESKRNLLPAVAEARIYLGGSRKVSFVSELYNVIQYKTHPKKEVFDYDELSEIIDREKPKLVITGGTAYPRDINYKKIGEVCRKAGSLYLADIAHEAGLVATGTNKKPFKHADIVTFTTHKTFRGPRGAVILCKKEHEVAIQRAIFPGLQGGPHMNSIAGIAVAAKEASTEKFKKYTDQVVSNAKHLASILSQKDYHLVSGGTDKHLILINMRKSQSYNISAKKLARALDYAGLVVNYNTVPNESGSPLNPSGIRLGTPIVTSRGMKEKQMEFIAQLFDDVNQYIEKYKSVKYEDIDKSLAKDKFLKTKAREVKALCTKFPIPKTY